MQCGNSISRRRESGPINIAITIMAICEIERGLRGTCCSSVFHKQKQRRETSCVLPPPLIHLASAVPDVAFALQRSCNPQYSSASFTRDALIHRSRNAPGDESAISNLASLNISFYIYAMIRMILKSFLIVRCSCTSNFPFSLKYKLISVYEAKNVVDLTPITHVSSYSIAFYCIRDIGRSVSAVITRFQSF